MSTVQDVYDSVVEVLLEPSGLTTGVYTDAQFLLDFREVLWDFLQQAGLVKALLNLPVTSGTAEVSIPEYAMSVEQALYGGKFLYYATAGEMDNMMRNWRNESGTPKRWHDDRLPVKTIGLQPTPDATGYRVASTADFYGTLSAAPLTPVIEIEATAPLYGTVGGVSGAIFIETFTPFYGTIGAIVPDAKNITILAPVKPPQREYVLTDRIDVLPDIFLPYIKYGILAYVFGRDGETRDKLREQYCNARFSEGVNLAQAVSLEALEMEEVMA